MLCNLNSESTNSMQNWRYRVIRNKIREDKEVHSNPVPRTTIARTIYWQLLVTLSDLGIQNWDQGTGILSVHITARSCGDEKSGLFLQGMIRQGRGGWSWIRSTRRCRPPSATRLRPSAVSDTPSGTGSSCPAYPLPLSIAHTCKAIKTREEAKVVFGCHP